MCSLLYGLLVGLKLGVELVALVDLFFYFVKGVLLFNEMFVLFFLLLCLGGYLCMLLGELGDVLFELLFGLLYCLLLCLEGV